MVTTIMVECDNMSMVTIIRVECDNMSISTTLMVECETMSMVTTIMVECDTMSMVTTIMVECESHLLLYLIHFLSEIVSGPRGFTVALEHFHFRRSICSLIKSRYITTFTILTYEYILGSEWVSWYTIRVSLLSQPLCITSHIAPSVT